MITGARACFVVVTIVVACKTAAPAAKHADTLGTDPQSAVAPAPVPQATASSTKATIEDVTRILGPFALKDHRFSVVLHEKHITGVPVADPEFQTTLAELEIKDERGVVHYHESFQFAPADSEFGEILSASAELLQGRERSGILLSYGSLPSTPMGGSSWQIFGLFDDKLVPFSKPISVEGELINPSGDGKVMKTVAEPRLQGEVINFRIWVGNFFVIYPVRVDFVLTKAMPAWRCVKLTAKKNVQHCEYRVEANRVPPDDSVTFVRLFVEADEGMGAPKHVVVRKNSKVEILATEGAVLWQESEDGVVLTPGEDFWLKVRIDGVEGWIHTQEDFLAIGLPSAG